MTLKYFILYYLIFTLLRTFSLTLQVLQIGWNGLFLRLVYIKSLTFNTTSNQSHIFDFDDSTTWFAVHP